MIIRRAGTAVGICEMTCQTLCAPENMLTSLAWQLLDSCTRVLLLRLLFACAFAQRVSLRRSLGGGHFDALGCGHFDTLGTAIATCALRHSTMKFAKLSNEASREASPTPFLEDLLRMRSATTRHATCTGLGLTSQATCLAHIPWWRMRRWMTELLKACG
jgi:hypothetical protein